jgi:DNA-binding NarL/FixJ family response regulator
MKKNGPIKVFIADDHSITRSGLKTVLSVYDDIKIIGEASNGEETIKKCKEKKPDVILMDLDMPILDGIEATRIIKMEHPGTKIIALTSFASKKHVSEAIKAGATSYIIKNISPDEISEAIHKAFAGESSLSPEATASLMAQVKGPDIPEKNLTEQEKKILFYIVKGLSNKRIAGKLYISDNTVKFHISNLLNKLNAANRAEAAAIAIKNDLV